MVESNFFKYYLIINCNVCVYFYTIANNCKIAFQIILVKNVNLVFAILDSTAAAFAKSSRFLLVFGLKWCLNYYTIIMSLSFALASYQVNVHFTLFATISTVHIFMQDST